LLTIGSFRFHFYSDEGNEPPHIHISTPDGECKFWLDIVQLARNKGVAAHVLRDIEKMVYKHRTLFSEKFNEYHNHE